MLARLNHPVRIAIPTATVIIMVIAAIIVLLPKSTAHASPAPQHKPFCSTNSQLCTETNKEWNLNGQYIGHDEPSLLFYSNEKGSGNSNLYFMNLPKDPPTAPKQDGTGGTYNFQLHPAFWFGMAMCDTQSAPNPGNVKTCKPDSDSNVYTSTDKTSPNYIGNHPGAAFMEMQFYPPSWTPWPAGISCDPTKWCAALNIDSLSINEVTGQPNNAACLGQAGEEYVNFAFITKNGKAHAPASPLLSTAATFTPDPKKDLFMNSGDTLAVDMHDTSAGFQVEISDLTSGQSGSMTASVANNFGQVKFDPSASTCTNIPAAFHPMYATSSTDTRVPWAAHSYNVAFSDEIGHFELCNATDGNGNCTVAGADDKGTLDADDAGCFDGSQSLKVNITGCIAEDLDFDGAPYQKDWPGTNPNHQIDKQLHAQPVAFTSPIFNYSENYSQIGFENDLPAVESSSPTQTCSTHTLNAGCTDPPIGAFYPIYTTRSFFGQCVWQLGGPYLPGTTNTFGGTATTEYGAEFPITYPSSNAAGFITRYEDFRQIRSNPCGLGNDRDGAAATNAAANG